MIILLAEPIVALLFEHGRFGPEATERAAWVLKWYGLGMPAFCAQHILLRAFYSLKDTLTPMWIGCSLVIVNMALSLSLLWHPAIREAAFGISTSATSTLHVLVSLCLLRRRMQGRIGARAIARASLKIVLAGTLRIRGLVLLGWTTARTSPDWAAQAPGRWKCSYRSSGGRRVSFTANSCERRSWDGCWDEHARPPSLIVYNPTHDCD